ncbi:hypothetical protein SteCoe_20305 [Stentor coeruleus]|uniref:VWFA domain-containing protein n=1 Tax=Stentor coeruleus TaxID=5963 RepID=A0A1R2BSA1_9CILI|nr:hypothetical protein SteCoe_20305 [Stentor coeruleus]
MDGKGNNLSEDDALKRLMMFGSDIRNISQTMPFSSLLNPNIQGMIDLSNSRSQSMPNFPNFSNMFTQDQIYGLQTHIKSNMPSFEQYQKLMNDPYKNPMAVATFYTNNLVLNTDEPLEIVAEKPKAESCENFISFSIKPLYDKLKLRNIIELPCIVTLKGGIADLELIEKNRQGLDLIFVVDISHSMRSAKIELVKKTMEFVITLLKDFDRISIIGFNNSAFIYCPLTVMNEQGKAKVIEAIKYLRPNGRTNIECGVRAALHILADRKVCNQVSSILLLSDGGDNYKRTINKRVKVAIEEFKPRIKSSFRMHTFGYGKDHDSIVMNLMAQLTNGNFYYVENEATVSDAFANFALLASNIQVSLTTKACEVPFKLSKVYSNTGDTVFTMPNVFFGDNKDSVFVLDFEAAQENFIGQKIVPIEAVATFTLKNGEKTRKTAVLELFIVGNDEEVKKNEKVLLEYYRVKGAESLKRVMEFADAGKFAEAREVARISEEEISNSEVANNPKIQALIRDIKDSQQRTQSNNTWNSGGRAQVTSIQSSHFNKVAKGNCMNYQNSVQCAYSVNSNAYMNSKPLPTQYAQSVPMANNFSSPGMPQQTFPMANNFPPPGMPQQAFPMVNNFPPPGMPQQTFPMANNFPPPGIPQQAFPMVNNFPPSGMPQQAFPNFIQPNFVPPQMPGPPQFQVPQMIRPHQQVPNVQAPLPAPIKKKSQVPPQNKP